MIKIGKKERCIFLQVHYLLILSVAPRHVPVCVLHIEPFFPPVDIHHTQSPESVPNLPPREIQAQWSQTTTQRYYSEIQ